MEKAILWLPGWGMADAVWNDIRSEIQHCRHLAPDYSQVTQPEHFWEAVQEAVLPMGTHTLFVVGWSMGGMLAQRLASVRHVSGLVLISTTDRFARPRTERTHGWTKEHLRKMQRALAVNREQVMTSFAELMASEDERLQEAALTRVVGAEWTPEALHAGLSFLSEEDGGGRLDAIRCPTLVIHGSDDQVCPVSAGERLASGIEQATFLPVAHCGHAPMIFHHETVSAAIKRMVENSVEDDGRAAI